MDKNKYSNMFSKLAEECAKELIGLFVANKIKKIEFNPEEDAKYIRYIGDDFGNVDEFNLTTIELKKSKSGDYLSISGYNANGETLSAYIDEFGGEMYDVEHSLPRIYEYVVEHIESKS